jgi:acetyl-CoA carboxylase carboxyltransferase component
MNEELRSRREAALRSSPEKTAARRELGLLGARERIDALVDPGSFLEVGLLSHSDIPGAEKVTPADGRICGYGTIAGRPVAVRAEDQTVLAGSGARVGSKKSSAVVAMAIAKGFAFVNFGEGGGARMPDIQGSDGLSAGGMKPEMALRNRRVPAVATLMGDCFGSPGWYAAFSDFVVQTKSSCVAVVSPLVLEKATGEKVSKEELGSWKVHSKITGLVDRVADSEQEAIDLVKEFLSFMPSHAGELPPIVPCTDDAQVRQAELESLIPESPRAAYDMRKLLRTIVDDQHIFEMKPDFDRAIVTALARLDGRVVGLIASNPMFNAGAMGASGCAKCTKFIVTCDSFNIPLIFVHDTPGFFVGKSAEHAGVAGKIINFYQAVAHVSVPKISLVVRKSYGMAYYNMGGGSMEMDFRFAWPSADISFMGPELAAEVVYGRKIDASEDPEATREKLIAGMRSQSAPWRAAGLFHFDDVISPEETRHSLIRSLALARSQTNGGLSRRLMSGWPTNF